MSYDYLPSKDYEFQTWVFSFLRNLYPMLERIQFPEVAYDLLNEAFDDFQEKLSVTRNPCTRSSAAIAKRNFSRKALVTQIRFCVNEYLRHNLSLSELDRWMLGLKGLGSKPAPVHPPKKAPMPTVRYAGFGVLEFHMLDTASYKRARSQGVNKIEVRYAISEKPDLDNEFVSEIFFSSRMPIRLKFEAKDRGKKVSAIFRWINTLNVGGPWTHIYTYIII
jgi:hypothetical protein